MWRRGGGRLGGSLKAGSRISCRLHVQPIGSSSEFEQRGEEKEGELTRALATTKRKESRMSRFGMLRSPPS